jgi:predicted nuclease of predicted toxin-antitoxin system
MKFIVDAHLPRTLAHALNNAGHDALHTLDLPDGNATTDHTIITLSLQEQRVVITKDDDFAVSMHLSHQPYKLLLVTTGNITNLELRQIFTDRLNTLVSILQTHWFVELSRDTIIVHR